MQGNSLWPLIVGVANHFAQMIFCMLQLPCFHLLPIGYRLIVLAIIDRIEEKLATS